MNLEGLTEEQKQEIIEVCLTTQKQYRTIAKEYEITLDELYTIINGFLQENNIETYRRTKSGIKFTKKNKETETNLLKTTRKIAEWTRQNGRYPRQTVRGRKTTKRDEIPEEEAKLGRIFTHIKTYKMRIYEGIALKNIEDKNDREIVKILRKLAEEYPINTRKKIELKDSEKLVYLIANLIVTKKATVEQIQKIAEEYRVNLDKVMELVEGMRQFDKER